MFELRTEQRVILEVTLKEELCFKISGFAALLKDNFADLELTNEVFSF